MAGVAGACQDEQGGQVPTYFKEEDVHDH